MNVDIICPYCRQELEWIEDNLSTCKNSLCSAQNEEIPFVNDKYVLVDFTKSVISKSVLKGNTYSQVERNVSNDYSWRRC